jgi:hypothetical protein
LSKYFANIFVGLVRARNPNPKKTKLGLGLASRTKPTKAGVGKVLPNINSTRVELYNKKSLRKKESPEQELQLIQYEVFYPKK